MKQNKFWPNVFFITGISSAIASILIWTLKKDGDPDQTERVGIFICCWSTMFFTLSNYFRK
jgi:hypothetical protein